MVTTEEFWELKGSCGQCERFRQCREEIGAERCDPSCWEFMPMPAAADCAGW